MTPPDFPTPSADSDLALVERANAGEVMILTDAQDDSVRALVKMQNLPNMYIFVGRPVESC